jgi:hypothetical protein
VQRERHGIQIAGVRQFPLPNFLIGEKMKAKPTELGNFIVDALIKGRIESKDIELHVNSDTGFFSEYTLKFSSKKQLAARRRIEAEQLLGDGASNYIVEDTDYGEQVDSNHMRVRAVMGLEHEFLDRLRLALDARDYKLHFAGSALVCYARLLDPIIVAIRKNQPDSKRILTGVDLEKGRLRMAVYAPGGLMHLEETADPNIVDVCAQRLKTYGDAGHTVILSGDRSITEQLSEQLKDSEAIDCVSVSDYRKQGAVPVTLAGDLEGKDSLFANIFAAAGMDHRKTRSLNYLYGGEERRTFADATRLICIAAVVLAVLLSAMLPIHERLLAAETEAHRATVLTNPYAQIRPGLEQYRALLEELRSYKPDEDLLASRDSRFAALISELREELLANTDIIEMVYDEQAGLLIGFITNHVGDFDRAKSRINDSGQLNIAETVTREMLSTDTYLVQIKISFSGGNAEGTS